MNFNQNEKYVIRQIIKERLAKCKQRINNKFKPKDRVLQDEIESLETILKKLLET